jgi:hypothetical protein
VAGWRFRLPPIIETKSTFVALLAGPALRVHVIDGANHWFGRGGGCPSSERAVPEFLPDFWCALGDPGFWHAVERDL